MKKGIFQYYYFDSQRAVVFQTPCVFLDSPGRLNCISNTLDRLLIEQNIILKMALCCGCENVAMKVHGKKSKMCF